MLQLLIETEMRRSLSYPARLHVHHQSQVKTFNDPAEARHLDMKTRKASFPRVTQLFFLCNTMLFCVSVMGNLS